MAFKAMKILAMDTALNACSVALMNGGKVIDFSHEIRSRGHAEKLLPLIKSMMHGANYRFSDLDAIAVTVGPGTFTGLRIGLAAARAISLAAAKPCIGVTTLECLAAAIPFSEAQSHEIVSVIDARRQELYFQRFGYISNEGPPLPKSEAKAIPITKIQDELIDIPSIYIGSGTELLSKSDLDKGPIWRISEGEPNPDARIIAKLAIMKLQTQKYTSPPAPLYLRAPDAKLPGGINPA